jgi:starvation-inducible DNA-binding protein
MIGLGDKLKVVLADSFSFYLIAHYCHWNVDGPDFYQHHKFLQDLYEEVYDSIDSTAEHIRTLDEYAPGSYKRFQELSSIQTIDTIPVAREMLNILFKNNEVVMKNIVAAIQEAGKDPMNKGIENYLQDRLDAHKKHRWMLKSFLR